METNKKKKQIKPKKKHTIIDLLSLAEEYKTALICEPDSPHAQICKQKIIELKARKEKLDKFWGIQ